MIFWKQIYLKLEVGKVSLDKIVKGIDGVFEFTNPPPKYIITESKFGTSKISTTITKSGGAQMSKKWISYNLNNSVGYKKATEILMSKEGFLPLLVEVSEDGSAKLFNVISDKLSSKKGAEFIYDLLN